MARKRDARVQNAGGREVSFQRESLRKSAATELYGSVAIWGKMAMGVIGIATGGKCRGKRFGNGCRR